MEYDRTPIQELNGILLSRSTGYTLLRVWFRITFKYTIGKKKCYSTDLHAPKWRWQTLSDLVHRRTPACHSRLIKVIWSGPTLTGGQIGTLILYQFLQLFCLLQINYQSPTPCALTMRQLPVFLSSDFSACGNLRSNQVTQLPGIPGVGFNVVFFHRHHKKLNFIGE